MQHFSPATLKVATIFPRTQLFCFQVHMVGTVPLRFIVVMEAVGHSGLSGKKSENSCWHSNSDIPHCHSVMMQDLHVVGSCHLSPRCGLLHIMLVCSSLMGAQQVVQEARRNVSWCFKVEKWMRGS